MNTIAWALILGAILAVRQISVGRGRNIAADTGDFVSAVVNGDFGAVGDIAKRRGEGDGGK